MKKRKALKPFGIVKSVLTCHICNEKKSPLIALGEDKKPAAIDMMICHICVRSMAIAMRVITNYGVPDLVELGPPTVE